MHPRFFTVVKLLKLMTLASALGFFAAIIFIPLLLMQPAEESLYP